MTSIPDETEFEKARQMMHGDFRGLVHVAERVKAQFAGAKRLYDLVVLPQGKNQFRAYVFFRHNEDVAVCRRDGTVDELIAAVYAELARSGRGCRPDIEVSFEIDSDENVTANFEGDYHLRLR